MASIACVFGRRAVAAFVGVIALMLLSASVAEARPYRLLWDANTDGVTAGYRVYYGTAPSTNQPADAIDVENVTEFQVDLTPGQTYYFVVWAYNSVGAFGPPSSELQFVVPLDPTITVSSASVSPGQIITATAADGPGSRYDWVGFYPAANGFTGYIAEKYLNDSSTPPATGSTGGAVTFTAPSQAGQYNVRFNSAASGTSIATSIAITVSANPSVTPSVTTLTAGGTVTSTIADSPGTSRFDWVGFYPVGNGVTGYIYEKYLNNSSTPPASPLTSGAVSFTTSTALPPGSYNVRLISAAGSTLATSTTITVTAPPSISLSATSMAAGASITATVSNSPGDSPFDWVGFFPVGNGNTGYIYEKYLNDSSTPPATALTSGTISFTTALNVPAGDYNIRLISAAGSLLATSATIAVTGPPTVTLSASSIAAGQTITATISNAPATSRFDWVGFYPVANGFGGYVYEKYLNDSSTPPASAMSGGTVTFALASGLPPGNYNIRLNSAAGSTVATSATLTVTPPPSVSLSTTTIPAGGTITATVSNSPGASRFDWVGFYPVANGFTGYLYEKYLNDTNTAPASPMTSGTVTFTLSGALPAGEYNVRLNSASGTTMATTGTLTVTSGATLGVSATNVAPGNPVTVTVANGPGVRWDWVGLFPIGNGNTGFVDWMYMSGTQTPPAAGISNGDVVFNMPVTPGQYEFRFFYTYAASPLAVSVVVTVP